MRKSICLLLVLLLLLTSCGMVKKESSPSPQDKQSAVHGANNGDRGVRPLADEGTAVVSPRDTELKDHLEQLAKRVPGVNGAHCVVMGNTAVVGIDVDGSLSRSRVGTVKYSVAEAFRKDHRGINALVTADIDMSSRIAELSRHFRQGRPVSGFAAEMADIIGRIIPQAPEDTTPRGQQ
ncbi:sporulation lipoprotein, YhcN/YlaJ family [Paenibacillus sophorae]|uniref:Sporulation lipoprotein, YhcN/YlaJ family n=1 Tax=Paenibacillus sophorae TaxID=1333845 RepID=A0A1H8R6G8_9BACL|nr:YhcN/YlaJ family sporulation lipoprotein [Paenibacillus sophorae]QWU14961.1 YhcN/YlaJ family sporulation lipoprotein [Paenibacillus sophorae]SEO61718.1 sporulation lipoprotein, YhcN/YlaJ family [Paenibacillus sophorae]